MNLIKRIISEQLNHPTGIVGRYILPFIWNRRNSALNDFTLTLLQLQPEDRILEIGFGGGYLIGRILDTVTPEHVNGLDDSDAVLSYCRARYTSSIEAGILDLRRGSVENMPYPDDYFSKVCSVNSLFYWFDLKKGIREIYRVLIPDGVVILTYTCKWDLDRSGFSSHAVRSYGDEEIINILRGERFSDISLEHGKDVYRRFSAVIGRK